VDISFFKQPRLLTHKESYYKGGIYGDQQKAGFSSETSWCEGKNKQRHAD
jgi:hypothetical protein